MSRVLDRRTSSLQDQRDESSPLDSDCPAGGGKRCRCPWSRSLLCPGENIQEPERQLGRGSRSSCRPARGGPAKCRGRSGSCRRAPSGGARPADRSLGPAPSIQREALALRLRARESPLGAERLELLRGLDKSGNLGL